MSCTQCGKTVIPSTVVVSDIPQNGALCDECNLKALTEPEVVIADNEGFPHDEQDANISEEAMVISGDGQKAGEEIRDLADGIATGMIRRLRGDRSAVRGGDEHDEETPISPESAKEFLTAEGVFKLLQSKTGKDVLDGLLKRSNVVTKPALAAAVESLPMMKMIRDDSAAQRSKIEAVSDKAVVNYKELKKEVTALRQEVTKLANARSQKRTTSDEKRAENILGEAEVAAMIAKALAKDKKRPVGERSPAGRDIGNKPKKSSRGKGSKSTTKQTIGGGDDDDDDDGDDDKSDDGKVCQDLDGRMAEVDNTTSNGSTLAVQTSGPFHFHVQTMMGCNIISGGSQTFSNAGMFSGLQLPTAQAFPEHHQQHQQQAVHPPMAVVPYPYQVVPAFQQAAPPNMEELKMRLELAREARLTQQAQAQAQQAQAQTASINMGYGPLNPSHFG